MRRVAAACYLILAACAFQSIDGRWDGSVGCLAKVRYKAYASDPPQANGGLFSGEMSVSSGQVKKENEIQLAWTFWDGGRLESILDFSGPGTLMNRTLDILERQTVVVSFPADVDDHVKVKFLGSLDEIGSLECGAGLPFNVRMNDFHCSLPPELAHPDTGCNMEGTYCCRAFQRNSVNGPFNGESGDFSQMRRPVLWMVSTAVAFAVIVVLLVMIVRSKLSRSCESTKPPPSNSEMVSIDVLTSARDPPTCIVTRVCTSSWINRNPQGEAKTELEIISKVIRSEHKWGSVCWKRDPKKKMLGRSVSKTIYMFGGSGKDFGATNTVALRSPRLDDPVRVDITERVIGTGAFSVVRVGVLRSPDYDAKKVAVKLVEPSMFLHMDTNRSTQAIKAIEKELKVFQGMKLHKNVVRYYGGAFNERKKEVYVVEELMNGNLNDLIHDPERMSECTFGHLLGLFSDIAAGLLHLHSWGTIHHDLKPANVLLDESFRHAKLSDFGCSRLKAKSVLTARLVGTLGYLPVECIVPYFKIQVRAETIDVYSMGVVMWESVTGVRPPNPYAAQYTVESASIHVESEGSSSPKSISPRSETWAYADPSERYPIGGFCPHELKELIWSCLNFNFKKRPSMSSVSDHIKDLQCHPWIKLTVRSQD